VADAQGQFRNAEEGEHLVLEAATKPSGEDRDCV
jgi:hypothetical protein